MQIKLKTSIHQAFKYETQLSPSNFVQICIRIQTPIIII